MTKKNFVGGNWKCNGSKKSVSSMIDTLNGMKINAETVDVVIAPSALYVDMMQSKVVKSVQVASQNVSLTDCGAFTGEIAASQLKDFGVEWTLTGHSERRVLFKESDEDCALKTKKALENGMNVIVCIGESLVERESGETFNVISRQLEAVVDVVSEDAWAKIVVAYEPVWAIGTGKVASPEQAQDVHAFLRNWMEKKVSLDVATALRIVYGGSVKGANCADLIALKDVDGFLVGGASLKPEFQDIIACAE